MSETLSKIVDWTDRRTCVLFGDGAGSVILSADKKQNGILSTKIYSDGEWIDSLYVMVDLLKSKKLEKLE